MDIKQFGDNIESSKDFDGIGMQVKEDGSLKSLIIKHKSSGLEVNLPIDTIKDSDWESLSSVMAGEREPAVLQHMSRVVGYNSKINNWIPSKISELKDRQKGDYEIK